MKDKMINCAKTHKKLIVVAVIAFLIGAVCVMASKCMLGNVSAVGKVAVVDVQQIVAKSSEINELKTEQEEAVKKLQAWLDTVKTEVEKQKTEVSKQALIEKYNKEFAEKKQQIREDYATKLQKIDANITDVIESEAKSLGYSLVVSKGVVLTGGADITDEIANKIK